MSSTYLPNAEKLTKAKAKLVMSQPFFASLVCNLPLIEDANLNPPTMATNGKYIKFHPEFVEKCTLAEVIFVLCHEVGHCMFQHMFRRKHRDPKRWNIAGDYIINDMLAGLDAEDMRKTLSIADRKEAIRTACMLAEKGDVILVAGKGHENYQEIKGVKHHFDDKEILKEIFK